MSKDLGDFLTPVFRVSFPSVFVMDSYGDGTPKYTLDAIWDPSKFTDKDKKLWAQLLAGMDEASLSKFKKKLKELPVTFHKGIRNGNEKTSEGYGEGKLFSKLSSNKPFGVVDLARNPIGPAHGNESLLYAGCYARAFVRPYAYDNKSRGVRLVILSLQKVAEGEKLDGSANAAKKFEDVEMDADTLALYGVESSGHGTDDEIAF
jgi:hypothetical protein